MTLYGIPNCNTVKKAQDWLKSNQIAYEFHDFKKKGVTPEKLDQWFDAFGWEKVINRNGLTFKKLSKEEQVQLNTPEQVSSYLQANTSAIKRPILERDGKAILIGFSAEDYALLKAH
ncbi:MAG: Spx/MgsR family RNA polymerase-binding regulatory protein [Pedobacter sp.]|nr:Spx/MgsR family RNA polymerase-binding regulatory protein [Pedobacter sp.]MDQ8054581.1 Spx/MgsR family RNA polymerase-binding regulatory protein [Pedobacter sp.]